MFASAVTAAVSAISVPAISAPAIAVPAFIHGGFGLGFFPFFFLAPLFWIAVIVVLAIVFGRRRRWAMRTGVGPWAGGYGRWGHGPWGTGQATRSAEATLAERFAQGDIEEKEYRARLEVLRANAPQPPQQG